MSNYATKSDLKNATGVHTSKSAKKANLTNLKSEVDKLGIGNIKTPPVYLSKLSDVKKMKLLKKLKLMKLLQKLINWLKNITLLRLLILVS